MNLEEDYYPLIVALTGGSKSSNEYTITGLVLDADTKTPLAGAKVYARNVGNLPTDSSITDAAGRTSFTFKKGDHRLVFAVSGEKNSCFLSVNSNATCFFPVRQKK